MKQYTSVGQTAKMIELGLADSIREERYKRGALPKNYSIGELIEMLETRSVSINVNNSKWSVDTYYYGIDKYELIDALFMIVVKCKENGEL
jgi:hypothetical protein